MNNSYLQSFVAGVASIACTVMALQLTTPSTGDLHGFLSQWHVLLAHFNSFFLIFILYASYSKEFGRVKYVDTGTIMVNCLWMIFLALMPFATSWLEHFPNHTIPELFFVAVLFACIVTDRWVIYMLIKNNPQQSFSSRAGIKERAPIYIALVVAAINSFIFPVFNLAIYLILTGYMTWLMFKNRSQDVSIL